MKEEFEAWKEKIRPDVGHMQKMLRQHLSDEPGTLVVQVADIEAWNGRAQFLLAEANGFLDRAKAAYLPLKEKGTELERKTQLDANVVEFREARDKIEAIVETIKQRLIVGSSMMAYHRQFNDPEIRMRGKHAA